MLLILVIITNLIVKEKRLRLTLTLAAVITEVLLVLPMAADKLYILLVIFTINIKTFRMKGCWTAHWLEEVAQT